MCTGFRKGYGKASGQFAVSMASLITYIGAKVVGVDGKGVVVLTKD